MHDSEHFKKISVRRESSNARSFAGAVILKLTYDHEVIPENDYYVGLADRAIQGLLQVVHVGSTIVDVVPALKYIPGMIRRGLTSLALTVNHA